MSRLLTILQINDTHGYMEPHPELFWESGGAAYRTAGGYARIATIFQQARAERPGGVLALDNGDTFHGTYAAVQSRGEALLPLLNALELDGMTAHWDFAYGPPQLRHLVSQLTYPLLAINCYDQATGELAYPPFRVVERGGVRVGIIGIAATIIDKTMPAHFSTGLRFTLGRDELPGQIARLREQEGAELIVVLSHLGFPQDLRLASEVSGIDILLSGHTHNRTYTPARVGNTWLIQSGCHGSFVGRLDLEIIAGEVASVIHTLIPVDDTILEDSAMKALVSDAVRPYQTGLNDVVGQTQTALNRNTILEATTDNLLLDAVAEAAGVPLAFSNGWRYGAPIPPGPITRGDLWNIVPPNPPVSLVELAGTELWAMMEENLERTFSCDAYAQMGGYVKRCRGMTLMVKLENPYGQRIQRFFIGQELLEPEAMYTAAFITNQGVPAKYGHSRRNLSIHIIDALESYLARHSPITASLQGTVIAV